MKSRIQEIIEMINNDPDDPFLHYALALEYMKGDQIDEAGKKLSHLLSAFADYLPVYYQAAHFYYYHGDTEKAKETFEQGIRLAEKQSEDKTLKELRSAYEQFLFEID